MFQIESARVRIFPFSNDPTIKMFAPGKFLTARERESSFKNFPPFEAGASIETL